MKHKVKFIYGIITISILLAGFLLPGQILRLQDRRQEERVDRYELNSITLSVSSSQLFENLSAVHSGVIVETSADSEVRMTEAEVVEAIRVANEIFGVCPLGTEISLELSQLLVINKDSGISFMIWKGYMENTDCGIDVIIDDATGKMLGITTIMYDYDSVKKRIRENVYAPEELEELLKTYYELADVTFVYSDAAGDEVDIVDVDGAITGDYGFESDERCTFRLFNEAGEYYDLEIYKSDGQIYCINWG